MEVRSDLILKSKRCHVDVRRRIEDRALATGSGARSNSERSKSDTKHRRIFCFENLKLGDRFSWINRNFKLE